MKTIFRNMLGFLLMITAMIGMIASMTGFFTVWKFRPAVEKTLIDQTGLLIATLDTTTQALSIANESVKSVLASLDTLQSVLSVFSNSIIGTDPMFSELSNMLAVEIPNTILATQESLDNSKTSAKIIDDLLRIITSIPFFPGDPYKPEIPLNEALGKVSESLDPLPESLITMQSSLVKLDDNLEIVNTEFELINLEINQVKNHLANTQGIIDEQVNRNQASIKKLTDVQQQIPAAITGLSWFLSLVFLWIAVSQIGLFLQGKELFVHV